MINISTYYQYNDPILITWRATGAYVEMTDSNLTIVSNRVILTEIPSEFTHIQCTGYTEIFSGDPATGEFITNYSLGELVFHPSQEGTSINAHFFGRGVIRWPAERIYEHNSGDDLQVYLETLNSDFTETSSNLETLLWMGLG